MSNLGEHRLDKYTTGCRLVTSEGRGWNGLLAETWSHSEGELGEVDVRDTEVIVLLAGALPIRRRRDGKLEQCNAVPGTIWLCPNGVHEDMIHLYGEVQESIHLFLPATMLSQTAAQEVNVDSNRVTLQYRGGYRDPLIEQIAREIRNDLVAPAPAGKILVESLGLALGTHLLRHYSNLSPANVSLPVAHGALDQERLCRVKEFIDNHLHDDMMIETLAIEAFLSPYHFARAFKVATGMAPHRYVTDRRLEYAKSLIADGRLPLAEIAVACGMSTQSYFSRWFKRCTGTTPGEYRKSCRKCTDAPGYTIVTAPARKSFQHPPGNHVSDGAGRDLFDAV